jgi:hypothetical protein
MPVITEQDIAAHHLKENGHLPDWQPENGKANRRCSVCHLMAGSVKSWSVHPDWKKQR